MAASLNHRTRPTAGGTHPGFFVVPTRRPPKTRLSAPAIGILSDSPTCTPHPERAGRWGANEKRKFLVAEGLDTRAERRDTRRVAIDRDPPPLTTRGESKERCARKYLADRVLHRYTVSPKFERRFKISTLMVRLLEGIDYPLNGPISRYAAVMHTHKTCGAGHFIAPHSIDTVAGRIINPLR